MCEDGHHEYVKFADSKDSICKECFVTRSPAYMAGYTYAMPAIPFRYAPAAGDFLAQTYAATNMVTYMNATAPIYNFIDQGTTANTIYGVVREPRFNAIITNIRDTDLT